MTYEIEFNGKRRAIYPIVFDSIGYNQMEVKKSGKGKDFTLTVVAPAKEVFDFAMAEQARITRRIKKQGDQSFDMEVSL
jgi:hypothetical protein